MKQLVALIPLLLSVMLLNAGSTDTTGRQTDRLNIVKVNMFPMLGDRLCISWENGLQRRKSLQFGVEALGMFRPAADLRVRGFMGSVSLRYYSSPESSEAYRTPMSGFYIEPMLKSGYTYYTNNIALQKPGGGTAVVREVFGTTYGMALLHAGTQFILYERFVLDFSAAAGFCLLTENRSLPLFTAGDTSPVFEHGFTGFSQRRLPLIATASVRIGYRFR